MFADGLETLRDVPDRAKFALFLENRRSRLKGMGDRTIYKSKNWKFECGII